MKPEIEKNIEQFATQDRLVSKFEMRDTLKNGQERIVESAIEKNGQTSENGAISSDVSITTMLPQPVIDEPVVVSNTTISDSPTVAADDDLIEKEWVDKAKKIISDNKDNPHQQEKEVSMLQVDYLKRRYGRQIGDSTN